MEANELHKTPYGLQYNSGEKILTGKLEIIDRSEGAVIIPVEQVMGSIALETTSVVAKPHDCPEGAETCGHRGFSLLDSETGDVIHDQPLGVNDKEYVDAA